MTEPHRFTSIMNCLTRITRQIVQQTSSYSHGQTYVVPLLMAVLPGIDLNDLQKTIVTLDFYNAIFKLIICVDCSSAIHIRNDLTEVRLNFNLKKNIHIFLLILIYRLKKKYVYRQQNLKILLLNFSIEYFK